MVFDVKDPDGPPAGSIKLDPDVIREMKRQGMRMPQGVATSDWVEPAELNHRHDEIICLMLQGWTKKRIAAHMEMSYDYIVDITNSDLFQREYAEERRIRNLPIDRKRLESLFEDAISTVERVMLNPEERGTTRLDAAKFVVEQAIGKAKQDVDVKGTVLLDVINSIERLRDATPTTVLDKPKTAADNFVDEFIPDNFAIGKRGDSGTQEES